MLASFIAFYCEQLGQLPFVLTGTVRSGLPTVALPAMHTTVSAAGINGTDAVVIDMGLTGMLSELGPSIALVPIIAVLGNAAIAKAFGGAGINPTKEIIALSLCNIFGSFVSSFPVTGSFSRSAVNHATGVKTPIGGIYTSKSVCMHANLCKVNHFGFSLHIYRYYSIGGFKHFDAILPIHP